MKGRYRVLARFMRDESGPTATEYAVLLALVIGFIAATLTTFGQSLDAEYQNIDNTLFP